MHVRAYWRLLRWLGPWAPEDAMPGGVTAREIQIERAGGPSLRARLHRPADGRELGAYVVAHGLSIHGPEDPRLERFGRVLAHAGFVVLTPFLPAFMDLRVDASVVDDFAAAFEHLDRETPRPRGKPGAFGISFGCLPVLRVASAPETASRVGAVVTFGGYADLAATMRFTLGERQPGLEQVPRDPLSVPVLALNLLDSLGEEIVRPTSLEPVVDGWYTFVRRSWGKPGMKEGGAHETLARELARDMDPIARELFLWGCGLPVDTLPPLATAVAEYRPDPLVDPRAELGGLRCPVHLAHGVADDVVPVTEVEKLRAAIPAGVPVRTHLTGLLHHTRAIGLSDLPALAPRLGREVSGLVGMLRALVSAGRG